ncbi:shikimate dehydrogenase [Sinomonas sp. JGH33]|uniref:Shikimate dehydrogenase n=1 Tax=Sinomonas terricola TaxID=3110330 RepID=A0ABU5T6R3_9MICC|nr:shikimate dehydrogenase [Sinomonas sp. JGH33]MEA5455359.1 shikimate dehydrogenase [Sinomonas sp. JGH33]
MTAARRQAAVLGHPIGHSRSPALHRAAYAALGEDIDYGSFDLIPEQLGDFVRRVRGEPGWCGLSVTMPLKSALVEHVDRVVGHAARLGALNTVVFESSSSGGPTLVGHNTDIAGIVEAFRHAGVERAVSPVVVGAGNTALAAVAAVAELGATSLRFLVRDPARAGEAVGLAERLGLAVALEGIAGGAAALAAADVAVSTLPPRAADGLADELASLPRSDDDGGAFGGGVLLDVAYDPWPSKAAVAWEERGGRVLHGLEMLVYQAVEQIVLFTGRDDARSREVIDVMCDSVGLPRRTR